MHAREREGADSQDQSSGTSRDWKHLLRVPRGFLPAFTSVPCFCTAAAAASVLSLSSAGHVCIYRSKGGKSDIYQRPPICVHCIHLCYLGT